LRVTNWNKPLFSKFTKQLPPPYRTSLSTNHVCPLSQTQQSVIYPVIILSVLLVFISSSLHTEPLVQSLSQNETNQKQQPFPLSTIQNQKNQINKKNLKEQTNQNKHWLFLDNYQAEYVVQSDGDTLGHATRKLTKKDGKWTLSTNAKIKKYFLSVKNTEITEFHLSDNKLLSDRFYSRTKITFKKARVMEQNFDWENKLETGKRKNQSWKIPLDKQVFDRTSHIVQMRADLLAGKKSFRYDISYKGKFHVYSYIEEKEDILQTKMGPLTGIKLVRQKSNGDIFALWLCPELNYLPIKIAQYEQDKPDVTLVLESIEYQPD